MKPPAPPSMIVTSAVLVLFLCTAWLPGVLAASSASEKAAEARQRDFQRCRVHADLDACYDAIRWNPSDPALLFALGDALAGAGRTADALSAYRRTAVLAPKMPGVAAKITALTAKKRALRGSSAKGGAGQASVKRFSNAAAPAQSH